MLNFTLDSRNSHCNEVNFPIFKFSIIFASYTTKEGFLNLRSLSPANAHIFCNYHVYYLNSQKFVVSPFFT